MKNLFLLISLFLLTEAMFAQSKLSERSRPFISDWRFTHDNALITGPEDPSFRDDTWRRIDLPHDWSNEDVHMQIADSIVGPFIKSSPSGILDGFTYGGIGWYRKFFKLDKKDKGKKVFIQFDGVYMNSDVWINGHHLGNQPYGYIPFNYDLSQYLASPGNENVIAVRVRNEGANSRWYAGSGIYREVNLMVVDPLHIDVWGVSVHTPEVSETLSKVNITTKVTNNSKNNESFELITQIYSPDGNLAGKSKNKISLLPGKSLEAEQLIPVKRAKLWTAETPNLYTAEVKIVKKKKEVDATSVSFGIRDIQFSVERGLLVSGKPVLLKGGCIHHDNGPLGAISVKAAEERKIKLLKENGYNAVRMSHNPPSKILLEVCDRLGMYVIDEAFDVWQKTKKADDYHVYFDEWWERDLTAMIMRDRNHPSVILWSIGNEIRERVSEKGLEITKMLKGKVKELDPTRLVTEAICDFWDNRRAYNWDEHTPAVFDILDVGGYNYMHEKYESDHQKYPDKIIYGSESYPSKIYEIWELVKKNPYVIGDFVWTAIDYRGEAGVANTGYFSKMPKRIFPQWPWFNAFCGDLDFVGHKKPQSYYRDVVWDRSNIEMMVQQLDPPKDKPHYYVSDWGWPDELKSWTWPHAEGDTLLVRVYTKSKSVKLELNGKLIGEQMISDTSITAAFHVPYAPGKLVAKGYEDGKEVYSTTLNTVGKPHAVKLTPECTVVKAGSADLCYVNVDIVDEKGNLIPYIDDVEVEYTILGQGQLVAVGNGNPVDVSGFQQPKKKVYKGRGLVILKSNEISGTIVLTAKAKNLEGSTISIKVN